MYMYTPYCAASFMELLGSVKCVTDCRTYAEWIVAKKRYGKRKKSNLK